MAASPLESERLKPEQNDDRISTLPNEVLLHILSFLPTKISVSTSLLSRRWRHLWKHLQVFDFDDNLCEFRHDDDVIDICRGFTAFVNAVLRLRRSRDIRMFRLTCALNYFDPCGGKSVATWVRAAIGSHLEELHLTLYCRSEHAFVVPHDLFVCTKLKSLNMSGGIHVQVPSTVRLLSLKTLFLYVYSVDFIDLLLSGCPVLETLGIHLYAGQKVTVPSTLKKLTIKVTLLGGTNFAIYAPSVEYLNLHCWDWGSPSFFSVENFHNMMEAKLDMHLMDESFKILFMLLRAICRTKTLVLCLSTTKCLLLAPSLELPQFHNLVHLKLILPWFNSSFLLTMLHQCNMLQVLNIRTQEYQVAPVLQRWSQPTSIPGCLLSHLIYFQLLGLKGNEDELAFVGYILLNGLVLETMIIHVSIFDLEEKSRILKELSVMPRGSNICQVTFLR